MPAKKLNTQNEVRSFFKKCIYASVEDNHDLSGITIYAKKMFNSYDAGNDKIVKPLIDGAKSKDIFTMKVKIGEMFDYIIKKCRDNLQNPDACTFVKRAMDINTDEEFDENLENVEDKGLIKSQLEASDENKKAEMAENVQKCATGLIILIKQIAKAYAAYLFTKKISLDEKLLLTLITAVFNLSGYDYIDFINNKSIDYKEYEPKSTKKKTPAPADDKSETTDTTENIDVQSDDENEATEEDL